MITTGLDGVVRFIHDNGIKEWKIRKGNGQNDFVFKTMKEQTLEENITRMRQVFSYLEGGNFMIQGSESTTGNLSETFSVMGNGNSSAGIGVMPNPMIGYVSADQLTEALEKQRADMMRDWEMQQMREEMKELKARNKELETPTQQFMQQVAPIAGMAIQGFVNKYMGGAAIGRADVQESQPQTLPIMAEQQAELASEDENNRVEQLLNEWAEVDPECLQMLEAIVRIAKTNKGTYDMAKGMLKNM